MRDSYLDDYYSFLRFASVSTDDQYKDKVTGCAEWLVKKLEAIGLETSGSRDTIFQAIVGFGTETVESGAGLDTIRVSLGVRSGF